jgi:hypothetical protein
MFYEGPSGSDDCRCNSVYYSLISGCAGCQEGTWLPYAFSTVVFGECCFIPCDPYWTVTTSGMQIAPESLLCQRPCPMSTSVPIVYPTSCATKQVFVGRFPQSIENVTRVPAWAFVNVTVRYCAPFFYQPAFFSTSTLAS